MHTINESCCTIIKNSEQKEMVSKWHIKPWLKGTSSFCLKQKLLQMQQQRLHNLQLRTSAISGIAVCPNKPRMTVNIPASTLSYSESYTNTLSGLSSWTVDASIQWLLRQCTTCNCCDFSPSTCFLVWSNGLWSPLMLGNCFLSNFWAKFMTVSSNWLVSM